ncbi:hypothetical protein GCM10011386_07910 [Parapedobacter defluvii]|uniref:DUF4397 domain-containing protein n=2 Tax=Parapedobacter defluvii TaxID=2045106 RepID=A0ABQ1L3Z2_9SPHI|nr:hypothetical protein GCM10011386_07910 [Parapedobacter defluvii]
MYVGDGIIFENVSLRNIASAKDSLSFELNTSPDTLNYAVLQPGEYEIKILNIDTSLSIEPGSVNSLIVYDTTELKLFRDVFIRDANKIGVRWNSFGNPNVKIQAFATPDSDSIPLNPNTNTFSAIKASGDSLVVVFIKKEEMKDKAIDSLTIKDIKEGNHLSILTEITTSKTDTVFKHHYFFHRTK